MRTQLFHNSAQIRGSELLVLVSVEQVKRSLEVSDLIVVQQGGGLFALQVSSAVRLQDANKISVSLPRTCVYIIVIYYHSVGI